MVFLVCIRHFLAPGSPLQGAGYSFGPGYSPIDPAPTSGLKQNWTIYTAAFPTCRPRLDGTFLLQDARTLPILHAIIQDHSSFYFMDFRRSNQMCSVIAICLAGQMRDARAVEDLLPILHPEEYEKPMHHTLLTPDYKRTITKGRAPGRRNRPRRTRQGRESGPVG